MDLNLSSQELEILINKSKSGDKEAFATVYSNLYTPLFRFVKSRTNNHDKSLDICQETFLKWYKSLETYEIKMKPLSYLMMISMRLIINEGKRKSHISLSEEVEEYLADDSLDSSEIIFDFNLDFEKVESLFEELTDNQKNVLIMRYISDSDTETIAEALDTSLVNVRKIESRALLKLKSLYLNKYDNENN